MEYLFLRRKRTYRHFRATEELCFSRLPSGNGKRSLPARKRDIRKVDCRIYKGILYQLEIRQVFLDTSLSLKKLSALA